MIGLLLGIAVGLAIALAVAWKLRRRKRNFALAETLARSVDGSPNPYHDSPLVSFEREGFSFLLSHWTLSSGRKTVMWTKVPGGFFLESHSPRSPHPFVVLTGRHEVPGPRGIRIETTDPESATSLLSAGLSDALVEFESWAPAAPGLQIDETSVTAFLEEIHSFEAEVLLRMADVVVRVGRLLRSKAPEEPGVQVLEERTVPDGTCQVCSAPFGGAMVTCAKCGTPHHRDCWDYLAKCATYGCGGTAAR